MKKFSTKYLVAMIVLGCSINAYAGNKDRTGQAGAPELTINPWAQSTGLFGLDVASVGGIQAMKENIAGLAQDSSTDIGISHVIYLSGTDININNLAVGQKLGESSAIGLNVMSMTFGDIPTTDYYNPQGYGSFHPQFLNIELGYAKQFSTHINAGVSMTYVSEQISTVGAQGLAFDAGIQYVTGKRDNFHFGITLCNLGTNMRFSGTGFAINAESPQSSPTFAVTADYPSDKFEMPTYLNIGLSYDFYLDENHLSSKDGTPMHRLSAIADFTSNSFGNDYLGAGVQYAFKNMFLINAAYRYENGIDNPATSTTMYMGLAVGATVQSRFGKKHSLVAFDYSFRPTDRPANGVHVFSLRYSR